MKTSSAVFIRDTQSSPSAVIPEALGFGPFRIPTGLDLLYRGSAVVPLEPRAVCVLRHLVRHAGRVVGKGELLDAVWPDTYVTEGVLKKAVSQIRRALGDPPQQSRFIETWHRRGYRFIAPVEHGAGVATSPAQVRRDELDVDVARLATAACELLRCLGYGDAIRLLESATVASPAAGAPWGHGTVTNPSGLAAPGGLRWFSKGGMP
ncbi:MAG TPA: transcriptional regulator [Thermoanaerobaculia bacterium]|nr:transcriptional regulator [Thermoanaerobaculia bacterium]